MMIFVCSRLQDDALQEGGAESSVSIVPLSGKKCKKKKKETRIIGMEILSSSYELVSKDVAKELKEAERDKNTLQAK